jgi:mannose-6-phosphate isomerase
MAPRARFETALAAVPRYRFRACCGYGCLGRAALGSGPHSVDGQDGPVTEPAVRPWGTYTVLAEGDGFKVKTIEVRPEQRLSYQRHARRSEHWFVVAGAGVVTLDGDRLEVRSGDAVDIPRGAAHRIHNTGAVPLVFVEVQRGDYFGEDDIVRLDDDYGRPPVAPPG